MRKISEIEREHSSYHEGSVDDGPSGILCEEAFDEVRKMVIDNIRELEKEYDNLWYGENLSREQLLIKREIRDKQMEIIREKQKMLKEIFEIKGE